jgi:hypothetical protein
MKAPEHLNEENDHMSDSAVRVAMVVSGIKAAFARIDRMAAEAARASTLLDRLEPTTLAKAFRGALLGAE